MQSDELGKVLRLLGLKTRRLVGLLPLLEFITWSLLKEDGMVRETFRNTSCTFTPVFQWEEKHEPLGAHAVIKKKHICSFSVHDAKVMVTGKAEDSRNSQIHPQLRCFFSASQ